MTFAFHTIDGYAIDHASPEPCAPPVRNIERIALIGNSLPRRCGIATYTTDVYNAFATRFPEIEINVWAMNERGNHHDYPVQVAGSIDADDPESYRSAARDIIARDPDLVWIQHEFGIFGGNAGDHILTLVDRLGCPIVATLHTILSSPDAAQRRVIDALVARCQQLIVMAEEGRRLLIDVYGADPAKVIVIPHGIPDRPFAPTAPMKAQLGFEGRNVILTFGLLSPGKGIETMIEALPAIAAAFPNTLYVVLGATHPHLLFTEGEAYRDKLIAQAKALGVVDHLHWVDSFVETETLLDYLQAADIYATPYCDPAQITSGTLSYAVGLGKPVVSTPYVHARELLANDHGRLVDFNDSAGFAAAIIDLLSDEDACADLRERTYALGRTMIWPRLAEASLARFKAIPTRARSRPRPISQVTNPTRLPITAIDRLTDPTGMFQHSVFSVPDRAHGYCVDDNARALILMCQNPGFGIAETKRLTSIFAAFIQNAWNPDTQRFRNFMSFDRRWLEEKGSDDSCGRTLWALAIAATQAAEPGIRHWAASLFDTALVPISLSRSPRTRAFTMMAIAAMLELRSGDSRLTTMLADCGDDLIGKLGDCRDADWRWFEPVLAYDNARVPEALLRAGLTLDRREFIAAGLETLAWLSDKQTASEGHFRAVGSDNFSRPFSPFLQFDQQPVEAWAMIDACSAAYAVSKDAIWRSRAVQAYRWFIGGNDLGLAVGNATTGECFDGLMPTGLNRNQGAESVLAFHLATTAINRLSDDGKETVDPFLGTKPILRHQGIDVVAPPITA
jgi:glycosyltransferase involved in cell wall biosynthesis